MALYEYKCNTCSQTATVARPMSEKEVIPICAACKSPLSRVYSSIGVTFNGGGFYSTDKGK